MYFPPDINTIFELSGTSLPSMLVGKKEAAPTAHKQTARILAGARLGSDTLNSWISSVADTHQFNDMAMRTALTDIAAAGLDTPLKDFFERTDLQGRRLADITPFTTKLVVASTRHSYQALQLWDAEEYEQALALLSHWAPGTSRVWTLSLSWLATTPCQIDAKSLFPLRALNALATLQYALGEIAPEMLSFWRSLVSTSLDARTSHPLGTALRAIHRTLYPRMSQDDFLALATPGCGNLETQRRKGMRLLNGQYTPRYGDLRLMANALLKGAHRDLPNDAFDRLLFQLELAWFLQRSFNTLSKAPPCPYGAQALDVFADLSGVPDAPC